MWDRLSVGLATAVATTIAVARSSRRLVSSGPPLTCFSRGTSGDDVTAGTIWCVSVVIFVHDSVMLSQGGLPRGPA